MGRGGKAYPVTPDGRYFVVRGRLWRRSNPCLSAAERERFQKELGRARSAVRQAQLRKDDAALRAARRRVDAAKRRLGERGPVWWDDGQPDYNRHLAVNTPYRAWFRGLSPETRSG